MLVDQIVRETGLSSLQVNEIINQAPHSYCTYTIPKRSGGGTRVISHPEKKLKMLQRWITERILADLPVHESVYSYRPKTSIAKHALVHKHANFFLRVDLQDFFPSITLRDVNALLMDRKNVIKLPLSDSDIVLISRLVCKGRAITIGSPSSPAISNTILYGFDVIATELAQKYAATYSRYADDLYFSTCTPNVLAALFQDVKVAIQQLPYPRLVINDDKTTFTSRKRKIVVTGLVISTERKISLGREQKRHIRGLLHKFGEGQLNDDRISYLKGYLSYCSGVEPEFIKSIKIKYGESLFEKLKKLPIKARKIV